MPHNLLSLSALVALSKEEQTAQLAEVNQQLEALSAQERVQWAFEHLEGEFILSSSFGIQAALMLHLVTQVRPDVPVVLTGDFNEWHDDRGLEPLEPMHVIAPGPSWPAPFPRLRYDRFAVSRGIEVLAHGVHDNDMARQASDHLPVWADIAFEPRSAAPEPGISGRIDGQLGE